MAKKTETELKMEFREFFGDDMIKHLSDESTSTHDMVEMLWTGFAHGYKKCEEDNDLTCDCEEDECDCT